nr:putative inner dynein arm light chain, axonemal [Halyomorpha halys]
MADDIFNEERVERTPVKKRVLITTFLKWSAPSMARKDEVYGRYQINCLHQAPLNIKVTYEEKCGELREVLDCIRPPRAWYEDGVYWRQEVSDEPATRPEVIALGDALDQAIAESNARETGLCEIREVIYADLFDELIRQVTINCIERGLLLLRIRNEAEDSIRAFQRLFASSIGYGFRKTLEADKDIELLKEEVNKLYEEKLTLEHELENVMFTIATREKELAERMEEIQSKHRNQLELLMEVQTNLKYQLLSITSLNKSKT